MADIRYVNAGLFFFIGVSVLGLIMLYAGGGLIDKMTIGTDLPHGDEATYTAMSAPAGLIGNMFYWLCFPGMQILGIIVYAQSIYKQTSGSQAW